MPENVNGITVPVDGDPVDLVGDLRRFAEDVGTAAEDIATTAGAAAATEYATTIDDARMTDIAADPDSAFAEQQKASYAHLDSEGVLVIGDVPVGGDVPDATTTVKGKVELATQAEAETGTDATKAITSATLVAVARELALPPVGVWKPRGWGAHWHAALDNSGSSLARLAVTGDSIMRGYFSSNLDTKGYIALLRAALQAEYGDGGSGFKGAVDTSTLSPAAYSGINYFTLGGTGPWAVAGNDKLKNGPGGKAIQPGSLNDYVQATVRGTVVEIFVVDASPFTAFRYSIDGAAAVTVNSTGARAIRHVTVSGLSAGDHTVRVTSHAGATYFVGISGRNATGVVVDNYAVQGSKADQWNGLDTSGAATNVIAGGAGAWSGGYQRPADLILYGSILNDAAGSNETTYIDDLKRFLDGVRGPTKGTSASTMLGQQDIAILLPHAGHFDTQSTQRHVRIAMAARDLAEQYGAALVNWWPRGHNSWDWMNAQGYWSDGSTASGLAGTDNAHPSNDGFQWMYDELVEALPELLGPAA